MNFPISQLQKTSFFDYKRSFVVSGLILIGCKIKSVPVITTVRTFLE